MKIDLGPWGLDRGCHLLLRHALEGGEVEVEGSHPDLDVHLLAVARRWSLQLDGRTLRGALRSRWSGAERAGSPTAPVDHPPARWGIALRGAAVEAGSPSWRFPLDEAHVVWSDDAARLYAQAAAAQWDPATAIPWEVSFDLPDAVEAAVVQVMTYLVENETVALLVPARLLAQVHPHFREILQLLAIQAADEARHIEVFTRRALLRRPQLGLSTAGGQASLQTLMEEPDYALATFLLSVLGEGSFLVLLRFLDQHAPDPVTRAVARLAAQDEARHVAFALGHLERHARHDPGLLSRLAAAVERRHDALRHTSGLNEEVFDALVLLAAGGWEPQALARGWDAVAELHAEMDHQRQVRLRRLGFDAATAARLSGLHTRSFM